MTVQGGMKKELQPCGEQSQRFLEPQRTWPSPAGPAQAIPAPSHPSAAWSCLRAHLIH